MLSSGLSLQAYLNIKLTRHLLNAYVLDIQLLIILIIFPQQTNERESDSNLLGFDSGRYKNRFIPVWSIRSSTRKKPRFFAEKEDSDFFEITFFISRLDVQCPFRHGIFFYFLYPTIVMFMTMILLDWLELAQIAPNPSNLIWFESTKISLNRKKVVNAIRISLTTLNGLHHEAQRQK